MTIYTLTVTATAFILAALLLREKLRRTARMMEEHRDTIKRLRQTVRVQQQELHNLKRVNVQATHRDRSLSDDWPPYGHGIEAEAKSEGES